MQVSSSNTKTNLQGGPGGGGAGGIYTFTTIPTRSHLIHRYMEDDIVAGIFYRIYQDGQKVHIAQTFKFINKSC